MNPAHSLLLLLKWGKRGDQTQNSCGEKRGQIRINTQQKPGVLSYVSGACQKTGQLLHFDASFKSYFVLNKEAWNLDPNKDTSYYGTNSRYKFRAYETL
jgi:hypothetical protein